MSIVALQATLANRFVYDPGLFHPIGENNMTVQTYGCHFLMQQILIVGSVSGVAREAASGGNRFVLQLPFHNRFMTLLA